MDAVDSNHDDITLLFYHFDTARDLRLLNLAAQTACVRASYFATEVRYAAHARIFISRKA
jgi:hypothetical protein